jgi:hypothetical protein
MMIFRREEQAEKERKEQEELAKQREQTRDIFGEK